MSMVTMLPNSAAATAKYCFHYRTLAGLYGRRILQLPSQNNSIDFKRIQVLCYLGLISHSETSTAHLRRQITNG